MNVNVITSCDACPHLEIRETYSEYLFYCSKEKGKQMEHTLPIPSWCPLKRKSYVKVSLPDESERE